MTFDTCNAVQKFGKATAICDLPHGHTGNHRAELRPGHTIQEWTDVWPTQTADAVVNPN